MSKKLESMKYNCPVCNERFFTSRDLYNHYHEVHPKDLKFICPKCGKRFINKASLQTHESHVHGTKSKKKCPICGKFFYRIKTHIKRHDNCHYCTICGKKFESLGALEYHRAKHYNKKYSCKLCDKKFGSRQARYRHEQKHKEAYVCNICKKVFTTKDFLLEHIIYVHKKESDKYIKCDVCGKTMQARLLKRHMREIHDGKKRIIKKSLVCSICKKTFSLLSELEDHIRVHGENLIDDNDLVDDSTKYVGDRINLDGIFVAICVKCGIRLKKHEKYYGVDGDLCAKCKKKFSKRRLTTGKLYI